MAEINLQQLDRFLREEQEKAFCLAMRSLGQREDSLDAVQDAMFKLVDRYSDKPEQDWAPLFYRILFNRIKDAQRQRKRWKGLLVNWIETQAAPGDEDSVAAQIDNLADEHAPSIEQLLENASNKHHIDKALAELPERQQQVFALRAWLEMDVRQSATVMGCSEGSVKTHYARARQALRHKLAALELRDPADRMSESTTMQDR